MERTTESSLLDRHRVGTWRQSLDGRLLDCNDACARILGYDTREELLRVGAFDYFNHSDFPTIAAALPSLRAISNVEVCLQRRNGTLLWVTQHLGMIESEEALEGVMFETTDQRTASERFEYQATHDPLTGLANRSLLLDRLLVGISQSQRREHALAVCVVDLDHFDLINVTFGRGLADRILKAVGDRLVAALRIEDTVARLGSDEFTLILSDVENEVAIASISQRLLDAVSKPILLDGHEIRVNASIGIAAFPADGSDPDTLLRRADEAMYRAKDVGRNTWQFWSPEVNARAFERQMVVRGLRHAIERQEMVLYYQPQINVQTGAIDCLEALLRWDHPEVGVIDPADFLPAAEQGGLIPTLGEWVIRTAARQLRAWDQAGLRGLRMAINLGWRQFQQPDLIRRLSGILAEEELEPNRIELEISERVLQHSDRTMTTLLALKNLGVRLALDDFGTGKSSLFDLRRLPFDTVKIDSSWIQEATTRIDSAALIQAMMTMARAFGFRVVAEGVETREQLSFLRDRACLDMQGYFFGRPMPGFGMEELLRMQH